MGQKRRAVQLVGGACLAAAALALLWPNEPTNVAPSRDRRRGDELDNLIAAVHRKQVLKDAVFEDLIAGPLTLAAAADRCEQIEGQFPELVEVFQRGLKEFQPGRTFRERLAHSVMAHCARRLESQPERAVAVLARLKAELAAFVGPHSEVGRGEPGTALRRGRTDLESQRSR